MPLVSRDQTAQYRRAVLDASSKLFRSRGFNDVSVADVMAAAGLTHGGFYGHFSSKAALAVEACAHAFLQGAEKWRRRIAGKPAARDRRSSLIDGYLTARNRDERGDSCPSAALATDVSRVPPGSPIRDAFVTGTESLLEILTAAQGSGEASTDRRNALADLATMTGAIMLSRASIGSPLSDEILHAARERLNSMTLAKQHLPSKTAAKKKD